MTGERVSLPLPNEQQLPFPDRRFTDADIAEMKVIARDVVARQRQASNAAA